MLTLKPSNTPTRLYTAQSGSVVAMVIAAEGQRPIAILGDKEELRAALYDLAAQIDPETSPSIGALPVPDNPMHILNYRQVALDDITPGEMIEIFRATPSLAFIADEFEKMIVILFGKKSLDAQRVESALDIKTLFNADGTAVRGAQSKVAQALGVKNAGSYRTRIQAVLRELGNKHSTTTQKTVEKARRAA